MIFVDLKDFSYGNEIEDLARVFYPNQRVETQGILVKWQMETIS